MMNPTPLLLLVPLGVVSALGVSTFAPHPSPVPPPTRAVVSPALEAAAQTSPAMPPASETKGRQLRFEEYLGKDPAWFEKRFGPPDGGTGLGGSRRGGPEPLNWRTFDRRPDLGGGQWQMASATYPIGEDPQRSMAKVLSVAFEGPVGGKPVATRVDHGVDPRPSRSFEQEATYVGINLADYYEVQPDRSNAEDRRMVNRKHPEVVLTANNLNATWHIALQIDPAHRK